MCSDCFDKHNPEPSQKRFDAAWKIAERECKEEPDLDWYEYEFSEKHVQRVADRRFHIKLTKSQAAVIVAQATDNAEMKLRVPFDQDEAEVALRHFCEWADLDIKRKH